MPRLRVLVANASPLAREVSAKVRQHARPDIDTMAGDLVALAGDVAGDHPDVAMVPELTTGAEALPSFSGWGVLRPIEHRW